MRGPQPLPLVGAGHGVRPAAARRCAACCAGAADRAAGRLRDDGWTVAETGNLAAPPDVTATTVYFGEGEGEKQSAEAVGKLLNAPVAPRIPELAEQPPGVVVLVTG